MLKYFYCILQWGIYLREASPKLLSTTCYATYILKLWNWNKNFKFRFTFFPLERKGVNHRIRLNTEEKAKVVAAAWGTALILLLAALAILHQDDLKKRMNRIMATWRNRCFEQNDDHPVHTIPNYHPLNQQR